MKNNNISLKQVLDCHKIGSVKVDGKIIDSDCESIKKYPKLIKMLQNDKN